MCGQPSSVLLLINYNSHCLPFPCETKTCRGKLYMTNVANPSPSYIVKDTWLATWHQGEMGENNISFFSLAGKSWQSMVYHRPHLVFTRSHFLPFPYVTKTCRDKLGRGECRPIIYLPAQQRSLTWLCDIKEKWIFFFLSIAVTRGSELSGLPSTIPLFTSLYFIRFPYIAKTCKDKLWYRKFRPSLLLPA